MGACIFWGFVMGLDYCEKISKYRGHPWHMLSWPLVFHLLFLKTVRARPFILFGRSACSL
jgi:hypothetical protein